MVISWVVLIPCAILIARYTRPNWPNKKFLGSPLWLNVSNFKNDIVNYLFLNSDI